MFKAQVKGTGGKSPYPSKPNAPSLATLKDAGVPTVISLIKRAIKLTNQGCRQ